MRRYCLRLIFAWLALAAPATLADDVALTAEQYRAAYCSGYADALEQAIGDTCIDTMAGWENACSPVQRQKERGLALLTAENAISNPGVGPAIAAGHEDYRQCMGEMAVGGPTAPACARLLQCDE